MLTVIIIIFEKKNINHVGDDDCHCLPLETRGPFLGANSDVRIFPDADDRRGGHDDVTRPGETSVFRGDVTAVDWRKTAVCRGISPPALHRDHGAHNHVTIVRNRPSTRRRALSPPILAAPTDLSPLRALNGGRPGYVHSVKRACFPRPSRPVPRAPNIASVPENRRCRGSVPPSPSCSPVHVRRVVSTDKSRFRQSLRPPSCPQRKSSASAVVRCLVSRVLADQQTYVEHCREVCAVRIRNYHHLREPRLVRYRRRLRVSTRHNDYYVRVRSYRSITQLRV